MESSWEKLRARFPALTMRAHVSLPSYSRYGTRARVYFEHSGDCPFCASGWEVILDKIKGKWVITQYNNRMIS
jgi:hypothetical protein